MTNGLLAALCGRAGRALRELHLDTTESKYCIVNGVTGDGIVTALRAGGCTKLRRLVVHRSKDRYTKPLMLTLQNAKQLKAALPKLVHVACIVNCENHGEVAEARTVLPGAVEVRVKGRPVVPAVPRGPVTPLGPAAAARVAAVRNAVEGAVSEVLGADAIIDGDTPLIDAGLDSHGYAEMTINLERVLGLELPSTMLFDYPTINAVVPHLATLLAGGA